MAIVRFNSVNEFIAKCSRCGELVVVSPSTALSHFLCIEGGIAQLERASEELMELTPSQVKEIDQWRSHERQR